MVKRFLLGLSAICLGVALAQTNPTLVSASPTSGVTKVLMNKSSISVPSSGIISHFSETLQTAQLHANVMLNNAELVSSPLDSNSKYFVYNTSDIMYANCVVNIRSYPDESAEVIGRLFRCTPVEITGTIRNSKFLRISYNGLEGYVCSEYLSEYDPGPYWTGVKLATGIGTVEGPSGKETYYNLPMAGVIRLMKCIGYDMEYSIREDGCKLYGGYIMLAADTRRYPKGTVLETTLGTGMVVDHCESAENYAGTWIDIAVTW